MSTVVLTVYFNGTSQDISDLNTLAGLLYKHTEAGEEGDTRYEKMGFSGTGVTNGMMGALYGAGLKKQCRTVKDHIIALVKAGHSVILNCFGFSRGGTAAFILANMLGAFDRKVVATNLIVVDPVPGNLITTANLDFFKNTLAKQAMDLSKCRNLRVFCIYPYEPLPSIAAHAPLVPKYPPSCEVEEIVVPGCHAGAQGQLYGKDKIHFKPMLPFQDRGIPAFIVFERVARFLRTCGTEFTPKLLSIKLEIEIGAKWQGPTVLESFNKIENADLKFLYSSENEILESKHRKCHAEQKTVIVAEPTKKFLNREHKKLCGLDTSDESDCALKIERSRSIPSAHKKTISDHSSFEEMRNKLYALILAAESQMSEKSKNGEKGELIKKYLEDTKSIDLFEQKEELLNSLRNFIALACQRDRNPHSFFSETASGKAIVNLLNQKAFRPLAELILNNADKKKIAYSDLRIFVLGEDNKSYFNAKNRHTMYQMHKDHHLIEDNLPYLLSAKYV